MRRLLAVIIASVAFLGWALPGRAQTTTTFLSQTNWTASNYQVQNLPNTSAWYTSSSAELTTSGGELVQKVAGSSVMSLTYFTPNSNSVPILVNVGDTLTATFGLTFNGMPANSGTTSQGFRIGLFNFNNGSNSPLRVTGNFSSSSSQGLYVEGYALFGKAYANFVDDQPIDIRKRTTVNDADLLGASGDWTSLEKDHLTTNSFDGFSNQTNYTLQFVFQRTNLSSLVIGITWSNTVTGDILTDSTIDNAATNFSFDGIALRFTSDTIAPTNTDFTLVQVQRTSSPVAPSIITQPQDEYVSSGATATFTVVPNGTLPLFYQWFYNTNSPLVGMTNATLALTNVQLASQGGYSLLISSSYGSVTSLVANLSVTNLAPSIVQDLSDQMLVPGQNATFTVVVDGSLPLYYQWYYDTNSVLVGATNSSFTLLDVQPTNAGVYSVIISNPIGTASSSNAVLTVNTNPVAPVFVTQPASESAVLGTTASFSSYAVGTTPITYQWFSNSVSIFGATSSNLTLPNVQFVNAGTYTVVASNSIGTTTSSNAVLTVLSNVPQLPYIPTNNYSVTNFNAVGNGVTDNSGSIQNAINYAETQGGGTVEIPAVGTLSTYESGPIVLANNINLQIDAGVMLQMLPRSNWPGTTTFISANGVHDIEISGGGTIDGNAQFSQTSWWQSPTLPTSSRPDFINIQGSSSNILIQGVTLQNPPTFHMVLKGGNLNLTIQNLTVQTASGSPNTDGMDLASTNVLIQNCLFSDGDDNIEIGGSSSAAADITISNCTFGTGHGLSIGSETQYGVHDLLVSNCTWNGTEYGIKIKTDRNLGGGVNAPIQNLTYEDLVMSNINFVIAFYDYYNEVGAPVSTFNVSPHMASTDVVHGVTSTTPFIQNITISNVTASSVGGNIAGIIWGLPESLISNVTISAVNISAPTKTFCVYNATGVQFIDSNMTAPNSGTNTFTIYNAGMMVSNSAPNPNLVSLVGLDSPPTNNVLAFFNGLATITGTNLLAPSPFLTLASSTFTVNNGLNLGAASTLNFGIGSNATEIAVTGNLTLGGTLNLTDGGGFTSGTYTLFSYGGALTYNGLTVGSVPNTNFSYTISTSTAGQVNLVVASSIAPGASFTESALGGAAPLTVNFADTSSGGPTAWFWAFGDGGTSTSESPSYTYVSPGAWTASLIASNANGASGPFTQTINVYDPFAWWQHQYFGSTNNSGNTGPGADYTGTGMSNTNKFMAGFNPINAAAYLHIISAAKSGTNIVVTYLGANGDTNYVPGFLSRTNVLDFTTGSANGGYANAGWQDTFQTNILSGGTGLGTVTNMTDYGGTTNGPTRYYRVRVLLP
jgi:polygalacturonase/PKD repeat protein